MIDSEIQNIDEIVSNSVNFAKKRQGPIAIVVKKKTFRSYKSSRKKITEKFRSFSKREDIIRELIKHIPRKSPIISTTGVTSRELFEIREENKNSHESDFLTIGGIC